MFLTSFWIPITWIVLLANVAGLLTSLFGLIIGLVLLIQRVKIARFYMLAWIFFIIGGVFYALTNLGFIPYNVLTSDSKGILIGAFLEVLFLSFTLADKINFLRREKNAIQKEALEIAQANSRLVQEQNQMLEKRVKERTQALQDKNQETLQQNQEILAQSKELQLKSEEIKTQRDYIEERNKELEHKSK